MSLTHVRSAIGLLLFRMFIFYLFKAEQYIPPVGYRTLDVFTTAAAPTTLLLVIPIMCHGYKQADPSWCCQLLPCFSGEKSGSLVSNI